MNSSTTQRACAMQKIPPGRSLSSSATHQVVAGSLYSGCVAMCGAKKAGNCPEIPTFYGIFVGSPGFWQGDNLPTIKGFTGSPGDGPIEKGV